MNLIHEVSTAITFFSVSVALLKSVPYKNLTLYVSLSWQQLASSGASQTIIPQLSIRTLRMLPVVAGEREKVSKCDRESFSYHRG